MSEQREGERLNAQLTVQLARGHGVVRDLSASGIYFETEVPLKVGEPVKFTLEFQDAAAGPISAHCVARIVRVEKKDGKLTGVAASFKKIRLYSR